MYNEIYFIFFIFLLKYSTQIQRTKIAKMIVTVDSLSLSLSPSVSLSLTHTHIYNRSANEFQCVTMGFYYI